MSLVATEITAGYGDTIVLNKVSLTITEGSVHALLGLNGAGKSTLIKIISGQMPPLQGGISTNGVKRDVYSINHAKKEGVIYVPQEVDSLLSQDLTVLENILIEEFHENKKKLFFFKKEEERVQRKLKELNLQLPLKKRVCDCTLYEKQLVLISKALLQNASYILFDEPTSALSKTEILVFEQLLLKLKEEGIGILLITHKWNEIFSFSDELTVLRDGVVSLASPIKESKSDDVWNALTHKQSIFTKSITSNKKEEFLLFDGVSWRNSKLTFSIAKGEIVVFYGGNGNGKSTLAKTLFGMYDAYHLSLDGKKWRIKNAAIAKKAGIAYVSEERRKEGLYLKETMRTHTSLSFKGIISKKKEANHTLSLIKQFHISPPIPEITMEHLSGGNQQKVCIAKWFDTRPELFILDEPMKGVDINARNNIFQFIEQFTAEGGTVIYMTNDYEEAKVIGDKIYHVNDSKILEEKIGGEWNGTTYPIKS